MPEVNDRLMLELDHLEEELTKTENWWREAATYNRLFRDLNIWGRIKFLFLGRKFIEEEVWKTVK